MICQKLNTTESFRSSLSKQRDNLPDYSIGCNIHTK